jgi:thiol:disulfide interchange protein DsbC
MFNEKLVKISLSFVFFFSLLASSVLHSDVLDEDIERITSLLKSADSNLSFTEISESPVDGFLSVQIDNGPLLTVSRAGDYLFAGDVFKITPTGFQNVADEESLALRKAYFQGNTASSGAIVFSPDVKTKATINVFTDITCGFCRKLHLEVPALLAAGVEVHYFGYPRQGLGTDSEALLKTAFCSDNKTKALTDLKAMKDLPKISCDNHPVATHFKLGKDFGVRGTPAVIFNDGTMLPGYRPASELIKQLGLSES